MSTPGDDGREQLVAVELAQEPSQIGPPHLTRVLERDGERLPQFRELFRRDVSDASCVGMATVLRAWLGTGPGDPEGAVVDGLAVHLLGALVNARRSRWTFGEAPLSQDDEEVVRSRVELCRRVVLALSDDEESRRGG